MALHKRIPQGPGSDPNPNGSLSHMRVTAYANDMERGTTTTIGRLRSGMNQIVRGNGILDKSFDGIKVDHFGFHVYGDNIARAFFLRQPDGTLAMRMNRVTTTVDWDSKATPPTGTVTFVGAANPNGTEWFLDLSGHEGRIAGDWIPSVDSAYQLGENTTPRRWKDVVTDKITFSDTTFFLNYYFLTYC